MPCDVCEEHSGVVSRVKQLEEKTKENRDTIQRIQDRPPVWATVVISVLTFFLGCSLTFAVLMKGLAERGSGG